MDTTELTRVLRDATAGVEPRPGFTAAVVRGGKRRKARNRIVLATGATAVTALVGTGTYVLWPDPSPGIDQAADGRLSQPTAGDLAGNTALVNNAARAWRDGVSRSWNADRGIFDDLRGTPHVYWAGTTPGGPAAVVMQRAYLHPHGNLSPSEFNTFQTLVGLVTIDPADGVLKLVYDQYQPGGFAPGGYFQFGVGDRTVLVVDQGTPLFFSPAPIIGTDGRITRDWQPMPVSGGVAMAQAPGGTDPKDLRVLARATRPAPDDKNVEGILHIEPASGYLKFVKEGAAALDTGDPNADPRLRWHDAGARLMRAGLTYEIVPADPAEFWADALNRAGATDIGGSSRAWGSWHVLAGLPDGRAALVGEISFDRKPSRIYAVLLKADGTVDRVVPGDTVDRSRPLPVRLRLPDTQDWIVADYGATLRYRTNPNLPWRDTTPNAALLPNNTVQVELTKPGSAPQVIELG